MPMIEIRDVPEDVHDELARRAALVDMSLQSYLLAELTRLSARPSMAEIIERSQSRAKATGSTVTMLDAVAAVRADRERHEP
jgi:antitoxin FitA